MIDSVADLFPAWLVQAFRVPPSLTHWQELGLAFLLGSFAVASWSDLKHLSAQREFREIWLAIVLAAACLDGYEVQVRGSEPWQVAAVKWGLILLLSLFSLGRLNLGFHLFRLAPADVAALAAAAALLTPVLILLLYASARLLAWLLAPVLLRRSMAYPFMPVVMLATLAVLAFGWLLSGANAVSLP